MPDYSPVLLGLAMGAYGLTQAVLQIPFGRWSDRYGRKPVIAVGLLFYAAGSLIGAFAHSLAALLVARLVQGAGAVSAAVTALLADLTRPEVRTRAMAFVGISIGLSFILALVLAPVLDSVIGVPGIFLIMLAMALSGLGLLYFAVPVEPARTGGAEGRTLSAMGADPGAAGAAPPLCRCLRAALHHDGDLSVGAAGPCARPRHPDGRPLEGLPRRVPRVARGHDPAGAGDRAHGARPAGVRGRDPARSRAPRRCSASTTCTSGGCWRR